ncbi:MAG TPA: fatty acid desaturase, partial [Gammaproteobacteria bacterium]|nr:fatty acid desaturase [Gammaproteobacteria bacterium]
MINHLLAYSFGYFSAMPWWGYILVTLVFTQITIFSVTLYLHRNQSHRSLELHPLISHFFRFWLWLSTGMLTKQWVAIHRKHHTKVETEDDPHSPVTYGIRKVFFEGAELYRDAPKKDPHLLERYGNGTPDDWVERYIYTGRNRDGIFTMLALNLFLFGVPGLSIWACQMLWIPLFAAGIINGIGHYWGYRNFETPDASRNIIPLGFITGGEELHNNHHTYANSAKFSVKWWEFDIGWLMIRLLQTFGLAKPNYVPPKPAYVREKTIIDAETIKALMRNRFHLLAEYSKKVILPVLREEKRKAPNQGKTLLSRARALLVRDSAFLDKNSQQHLESTLAQFKNLSAAYQLRLQLQNLWQQTAATQKELIDSLYQWCQQAEMSGIQALKDFARY